MCKTSGVAFFWKQWGGLTPKSRGRLLDGVEWKEYPVPAVPVGNASRKHVGDPVVHHVVLT